MSDGPLTTILLVCRNRRDSTLAALRRIKEQDFALPHKIVLFDDASTDGTPEAVLGEFPATTVVNGDGNAFWNGGLYHAWQHALSQPSEAFLWLNDDVVLDHNAFGRIAEVWRSMLDRYGQEKFILVGATRDHTGAVSYSGYRRRSSPISFRIDRVDPGETPILVDTFNGNIVLVPRAVVDQIGINDPGFHHNMGDIDYGLRARRADIPVVLLPGTLGVCDGNIEKSRSGYGSPTLTLREQWKKVNTHHGLPFLSWFRLTMRHSGIWWPLHFIIPYRWLIVPGRRRKVKDAGSVAI